MAFRKKMSRQGSRKSFTRGAMRIHGRNATGQPMRGGIRL